MCIKQNHITSCPEIKKADLNPYSQSITVYFGKDVDIDVILSKCVEKTIVGLRGAFVKTSSHIKAWNISSDTLIFLAHNGPTGLGGQKDDIWGCDFRPAAARSTLQSGRTSSPDRAQDRLPEPPRSHVNAGDSSG